MKKGQTVESHPCIGIDAYSVDCFLTLDVACCTQFERYRRVIFVALQYRCQREAKEREH